MDEGGSTSERAATAGASPPVTGPRFPWAAALLCAACVGAAGWTWMRYSYAWDVTQDDFCGGAPWQEPPLAGYYTRIAGTVGTVSWDTTRSHVYLEVDTRAREVRVPYVRVRLKNRDRWNRGQEVSFCGRVTDRVEPVRSLWEDPDYAVYVDATASRFHGASVSGLVVGAMGLVVFALYFRQWLKERRPGGAAPDAPC